MMSSATPSPKHEKLWSPPMLSKGSTAIDGSVAEADGGSACLRPGYQIAAAATASTAAMLAARLQPRRRARLVALHERGVARHIGCQNGSKTPLHGRMPWQP